MTREAHATKSSVGARRVTRRRPAAAVVLAGWLIVSGCGGGNSAPPPAPPPPSKAPTPVTAVAKETPRVAPAAHVPGTDDGRAASAPGFPPVPEGVLPQDLYLVALQPYANFALQPTSDGVEPDDWFVAVRPAAGQDSRSFTRIPPTAGGQGPPPTARIPLPPECVPDETSGWTVEGLPHRIRCETDQSEMVLIPGGLFRLGYDGGDANAAPAHTVELDPYYIDVFEVTVGRYAEFVKGGRSAGRVSSPAINADQAAEFPALGVSWGDALRYSEWVGKSLPTEAQWELAGRGPNSFEHPWGYGRPAWPQPRVHGEIRAVGSSDRDRSLFGVYDMAGNAREWVADYFSDAAYRRSTAGEAAVVRNPTGPRRPSISNHRVVKGGSPEWDLWHRGSASIGDPPRDVGFRCVLPLTKGPDGTLTFVRKEATRSGEPTARRP